MTLDQIAVRFYCHSDTPAPDRRRQVTRRLSELAASGAIDSYSLQLWPKAVSLDALGETSNQVLETYEAAQTWAQREGVSITPPFSILTDEWQLTGETDRRLHTPNMCLVVERDDQLLSVYPHQRGQEVRTLGDGLTALETVASVDVGIETDPVEPVSPSEETDDPGDPRLEPIER